MIVIGWGLLLDVSSSFLIVMDYVCEGDTILLSYELKDKKCFLHSLQPIKYASLNAAVAAAS